MTTEKDKSSGAGKSQSSSSRSTPRRKAKASTKAGSGAGTKPPATAKKAASKARSPRRGSAKKKPDAQTNGARPVPVPVPVPRLLARFRDEVAPALIKEFEYTSPMAAPRLSKIVLNMGLGEALENARAIETAAADMSLISGQHPVTTRARKSIAGFKLREGMPLGITTTLRGRRMYEFFDRLVSSSLPRIRDFRGVSREAFDGRGNYSMGIREQVIFPEIDYNAIDRIRGLQIAIVTTAKTDREGLRLLELLGVPFARTGEAA